jgi:hypothetical protein
MVIHANVPIVRKHLQKYEGPTCGKSSYLSSLFAEIARTVTQHSSYSHFFADNSQFIRNTIH